MTIVDFSGLAITGATANAAAGYDNYVRAFLSYGADIRDLFAIADDNPGAPLLNAHAAALHLAFEGAEGWTAAAPYLKRMRAAGPTNQREQLFCAAVEAWTARDYARALDRLDALTSRWPEDLCALKWGQYHAFNLGDQAELLRLGERVRLAHENTPYAHGLLAFALEQNHRFEEAEDEGMRAAEIAIDDAWAHHAVAHVMDAQGRASEGERWLDHCAHTWETKGVFIRDHNWWHAALFRLAQGREDDALAIYDARLWGEWPEFPQEQIGAISMLWRLEMRGVDIGERWTPVVEQAQMRAGEHFFPFHDLHYLYALTRAGDAGSADAMLASLTRKAECDGGVWQTTCLPAARAVRHFADGEFDDAARHLAPVMNTLHQVGGSHAQRQVFADTLHACAGGKVQHAH